MATEEPKHPSVCALGLVSVWTKTPVFALKTWALPAQPYPPAFSLGAPTTARFPLMATEMPKYPFSCAFGLDNKRGGPAKEGTTKQGMSKRISTETATSLSLRFFHSPIGLEEATEPSSPHHEG